MGLLDFFRKRRPVATETTPAEPVAKQPLPAIEKEGYEELINLCVDPANRSEISGFVATLQDYKEDEEYLTTLNYVMEFVEQKDMNFILRFDWKENIIALEHRATAAAAANFDEMITLTIGNSDTSYKPIYESRHQEALNKLLNAAGLQVGFIDTRSDEYVAIVHRIADREEAATAVNKTGHHYFDRQ